MSCYRDYLYVYFLKFMGLYAHINNGILYVSDKEFKNTQSIFLNGEGSNINFDSEDEAILFQILSNSLDRKIFEQAMIDDFDSLYPIFIKQRLLQANITIRQVIKGDSKILSDIKERLHNAVHDIENLDSSNFYVNYARLYISNQLNRVCFYCGEVWPYVPMVLAGEVLKMSESIESPALFELGEDIYYYITDRVYQRIAFYESICDTTLKNSIYMSDISLRHARGLNGYHTLKQKRENSIKKSYSDCATVENSYFLGTVFLDNDDYSQASKCFHKSLELSKKPFLTPDELYFKFKSLVLLSYICQSSEIQKSFDVISYGLQALKIIENLDEYKYSHFYDMMYKNSLESTILKKEFLIKTADDVKKLYLYLAKAYKRVGLEDESYVYKKKYLG